MRSYRKELRFNIPSRHGFVNIPPEVEVALHEIGIREGFVLVNHKHLAASTTVEQATDNAGHIALANACCQAAYNFAGFFSPVENLSVLNIAHPAKSPIVRASCRIR